jgi:hypothetical protein
MSTIQKVNFEPVTDILPLHRRDFALADPTLLNPQNPVCAIDGEWFVLNSSYQILRASTIGTLGNLATLKSFPSWAELGRYDTRAQSKSPLPLIFRGEYEFDTRVYDASVSLGSGAPITFVLQGVKAATIAIGGRNFTGLVGHGGSADASPVVGYVTRLPSANGGKLRFINGYRV